MIKQLLLKDEICNDIFSENLFISLDKTSALKADYQKVLMLLKVYNEIEIMEYRHKELAELHSEEVYILKGISYDSANYLFVRLVIINNEKLTDVLVYTLGNSKNSLEVNKQISYYQKIFFSNDTFTPSEGFLKYFNNLFGTKVTFILENNHLKLIYKTNDFLKLVGYEDWDFENKHQNYLDMILNQDVYHEIKQSIKHNQEFMIRLVFDRNVSKTIQLTAKINMFRENDVRYYFIMV